MKTCTECGNAIHGIYYMKENKCQCWTCNKNQRLREEKETVVE